MSILLTLQEGPLGQVIGKNTNLVGAVFQYVHILGFVFLLSAALLLALRVFGQGLRAQTLAQLNAVLRPFLWWGLAAAVFSGVVMFASNAVIYATNPALQIKLLLLVLAAVLQLVLSQRWLGKPGAEAPSAQAAPTVAAPAQASLAASIPVPLAAGVVLLLLLWLSTAVAGRAIGFI